MTKPQTDTYKMQEKMTDSPPYSEADEAQPVQAPEPVNGVPHPQVRGRNNSTNAPGMKAPPPINESVTNSLNESQQGGVSPSLIAKITEQVLREIESRKQPNTHIPPHFYPPPPPPNAPLSPTASVHSQPAPPRDVYTPPSPQRRSEFIAESPPRQPTLQRTEQGRSHSPFSQTSGGSRRTSTNEPPGTARPTTAVKPSSPIDSEETTLEKIWGKLFENNQPTEKIGQLLRGMAEYMIESYEPKNSLVLTPDKMQRYYRDTHISEEPYPWHTIFDDSVSCISRLYRDLGCEHHLVQEPGDFYVKPDIPGLTPRGFQQWATMLILAHPDEAFQRLRRIVRELPINNPDLRNERFPKELPRRLFPLEPNLQLRGILVGAIEEHARVSIRRSSPNDTPRQFSSTQSTPAPPPQQQAPPQQQPPPPQQAPILLPPPPQQSTSQQPQQQPPPEIIQPQSREEPSEAASVSSEASMSSSIERERNPYSGKNMPASCAIDDTNPMPVPPPLERVRKPYSGQKEGEGRNFDLPQAATAPPAEDRSRNLPDERTPMPPMERSQMPAMVNNIPPPPRQTNSQPPPPPQQSSIRRTNSSSSRPINIPPAGPPRQRGEHGPPPLAASATFSPAPRGYTHRASVSNSRRRAYSPPPGAPFRASESDIGSHGMSASFENGYSWDGRDDARREDGRRDDIRRDDSRRDDGRRDDGRRHDYREDSSLPPPPIGRRDTTRGASPGRRSSMFSDEDFYRPRRETTSGRAPW